MEKENLTLLEAYKLSRVLNSQIEKNRHVHPLEAYKLSRVLNVIMHI